jgi:hypothetical protein
MRRRPFSPWVVATFVPELLAGLGLLAFAVVAGRRRVALLRDGTLTTGTCTGKEPTRSRVNRQRVYRFRFRFTALDGREGEAVATTHRVDTLAGDAPRALVYDPGSLRATLLDPLPGSPRVVDDDSLVWTHGRLDILILVGAAAVLLGWAALGVVHGIL